MINLLIRWYHRRFSDPEAIALLAILLSIFGVIYFFHGVLAPLLIAIALAYLLEWPVSKLVLIGLPRTFSTLITLFIFGGAVTIGALIAFPIAWQQSVNLTTDFPNLLNRFYSFSTELPKQYPTVLDAGLVDNIAGNIRTKMLGLTESLFKYSVASLKSLVTIAIYAVIVPMMVFFLLKDKDQMQRAVLKILPRNRRLAIKVWVEMNQQISNYIRGKAAEVFVVTIATYLVFFTFDLQYSLLLAICVGLSVIIPYVGAVIVSIPVALAALAQWGMGSEFLWLFFSYIVVQGLDGNLLVPVLFSEAVNLHPLIIILSVVIFGGLWGFWGAFFAIPLATLIKAVINAWPEVNE